MHISVIATDFDGTIAKGDQLAPQAADALRRWREPGRSVVLASGRSFDFLRDLQKREKVFDLIVAENGAVLYNPRTDEMHLPFGEVPGDLLDMLDKAGVPMWKGVSIAGTTLPYDDAVWVASRELGITVNVETNRNEVMLLPPGASKGAGLLHLLHSEGFSSRNLLAFGDAENDLSLLRTAEVKVAVSNAIENLRAIADHVTAEPGPVGVASFIERYLQGGREFDFPVRGAHRFNLGSAGTEAETTLSAYDLVDRNVLIAGGSGYSKSWLASRLADGLIDGGYQLLVLDPVGDLSALRRHTSCLCLGREETPPISLVVQLLAETHLSLVLDLSPMPTREEQVLYTTGLLRRVLGVRYHFGKPHWILVDEAQDLLGAHDAVMRLPLLQDARSPGLCLVTWQPSRLDSVALDRIDGFVLTRHRLRREVVCLSHQLIKRGVDITGLAEHLAELGEGEALTWGLIPTPTRAPASLRFWTGPRVFSRMHRLHRYLEEPAAPPLRFYFQDPTGQTAPAGNLSELIERMHTLDLNVIAFHFQNGDFSRWIRDMLHDETLARWIDRLQAVDLPGEELRLALLEVLEQRHRVLERLI